MKRGNKAYEQVRVVGFGHGANSGGRRHNLNSVSMWSGT